MFHYTNKEGYDGIRSQPVWKFRAQKPPCEHPTGAYFTDLDEKTPRLAQRLRISKAKLSWVFSFVDVGDLKELPGGRGKHIFYATTDYDVVKERQHAGYPKETGLQ